MLSFKELLERYIDPVKLGKRVSKIYGTDISPYEKWENVKKSGFIPLSSFDEDKSGDAAEKLDKVYNELGEDGFNKAQTKKSMNIKDLVASQPYVKTDDVNKLSSKIKETNPKHISVVTHKGIHYINDGHHAVMAAKLRGDKTVNVNHIDLDKYPD